jgi:hypothetical protein
VFDHACKLGCEGIVSKRLGSRYRPGPQVRRLGQGEEPGRAGCEAGSRGGLGQAAMKKQMGTTLEAPFDDLSKT